MAATMLQHYKVCVNLCVYTQTNQYTPTTSAIRQKGFMDLCPILRMKQWFQGLALETQVRNLDSIPHIC